MLGILALLCFVGWLICFIIVLIKQFQTAGPIHGIIGIITCGIWTFIWGWMNASNLNIRNIMLIWSVFWVICIVLRLVFGAGAMMSYGRP